MGAVPPFGAAGSPSNTMWPGPRLTSVPSAIMIHPAVWPRCMGRKVEAAVPPPLGAAGSPSNTTWQAGDEAYLRAKFHLDPQNRNWPQYTKVTDRTGQDRQTDKTDRQTDKRSPNKNRVICLCAEDHLDSFRLFTETPAYVGQGSIYRATADISEGF